MAAFVVGSFRFATTAHVVDVIAPFSRMVRRQELRIGPVPWVEAAGGIVQRNRRARLTARSEEVRGHFRIRERLSRSPTRICVPAVGGTTATSIEAATVSAWLVKALTSIEWPRSGVDGPASSRVTQSVRKRQCRGLAKVAQEWCCFVIAEARARMGHVAARAQMQQRRRPLVQVDLSSWACPDGRGTSAAVLIA